MAKHISDLVFAFLVFQSKEQVYGLGARQRNKTDDGRSVVSGPVLQSWIVYEKHRFYKIN